MTHVLMKKGNLGTGTWRMSGEDEGKDWDDVSTCQGMPKMASTLQMLGKSHGIDPSLSAFRRKLPWTDMLILDL